MPVAAGFHHPHVRAARTLHLKKHRQVRRCFLIEGPTAVEAALSSPALRLEHVFFSAGSERVDAVAAQAAARGLEVFGVDRRTMRSLSQTQEPQGIVAVAGFFHGAVADLPDAVGRGDDPCVVAVLHDIADPGNAGTLIRSAEAFGAGAICFGAAGIDPYNDKVVRASMGSMFHIPLFRYDRWEELATAARAAALTIIAAEARAQDVRSVTLPSRVALVIGHERRGLAGLPADNIALRVGISQSARAESLNAAVAGSILLYELSRVAGIEFGSTARTSAP